MYQSGKTYGHEIGLSCAFRQPKADSHCNRVHGYSLSFALMFEADALDKNGWVIDFGALKQIKNWLEFRFDHKTVIAADDPHLAYFEQGHELKVLDLVVLPAVGCEKFAEYVFAYVKDWLVDFKHAPRVELVSVKVSEHGANSATYINPKLDISRKQNALIIEAD
jgi:6-pyruvoyltetrahydropterin/6-carboxytetrahydropterin synthase